MKTIAEVPVDRRRGRVFEHGWQSWSPTGAYPVIGVGPRPPDRHLQTMRWRPGRPAPAHGFQGEGLLAVDPGTGESTRIFAARSGLPDVPSIRARLDGYRLVIEADGDVVESQGPLPTWADAFAAEATTRPLRPAPTVWCSWYHYYADVTEADVVENLEAIRAYDLPVDVIQIDDGWQAEIGDWHTLSDRFADLESLAGRIRGADRRAGIWIAPFLVGARSAIARDHPEWLLAGAGHNWDQELLALDTTHPGAAAHLRGIFTRLCDLGFDYFKLDFLYAGALDGPRHRDVPGISAYREGMALIREAVGAGPYLVGCGAPILPSVGLVDAMRVSPDIGPRAEPQDGDLSRPSQRAAAQSTVARAWQHGRFWVNDPDCLLARPAMERREDWAAVIDRYGGLRASSDRIADLDDWGLATTRRLLSEVPPPTPFRTDPKEAW